jgi:DNA modification methylase
MNKQNFKVDFMDITAVIPYEENPRQIGPDAVSKVAKSIKKYGFVSPIIVNDENVVLAGHTRLQAAISLGLEQVPVHTKSGLSEAAQRAYRLADNRVAEESQWDFPMLTEELEFLKGDDFDLTFTGFDPDELDKFLGVEVEDGLTEDDAVPEVADNPTSVLGDVWQLGNHRLLCGDSTSIDAVDILMDGQKADMVFTDPPYNIDYGNNKSQKHKIRPIENDNMSAEDFSEFCAAFVACIKVFCDGCVYVFGPPAADGRIMFAELDKALHCSTTIIWNKDRFTLGRGKYQNKYEPCWFGWNKNGAAFVDDRKLTNVWDFARPSASKLHPTMKPVELVSNAIGHASNVGGVVLDLFGGSGSTLIACEKLSRSARLIELDPVYCDVIIKRWQDFTGKAATLNGSGQTFEELEAKRCKAA